MTFTTILLILLAIMVGILFGTLARGAESDYQYRRRSERDRRDYNEYFRSIEDD